MESEGNELLNFFFANFKICLNMCSICKLASLLACFVTFAMWEVFFSLRLMKMDAFYPLYILRSWSVQFCNFRLKPLSFSIKILNMDYFSSSALQKVMVVIVPTFSFIYSGMIRKMRL